MGIFTQWNIINFKNMAALDLHGNRQNKQNIILSAETKAQKDNIVCISLKVDISQ